MPIEWPEALPYAQLRLSSCFSIGRDHDMREVIMESATHINERNSIDLWRSVQAGANPSDTLDMAMRMYTGCGASKDVPGALSLLFSLVEPDNVAASKTPRSIKGRALSVQARIHFDNRFERKGAINIDVVYRAAACANASAALGFVTPDVIQVATHVEAIGFRRPEDNKFKEHSTERFEKLTDMWEALDRRKASIQLEDEKQAEKIAQQPSLYACAAQNCGIEAKSKSGLSACGGKCPPVAKPSYCSKECQRKDWKRHKQYCKADLQAEDLQAAIEQLESGIKSDRTASASLLEDTPMQFFPDGVNESGKEHSVRVQLGDENVTKISSKTMNPAFMKEVADHLENRVKESPLS